MEMSNDKQQENIELIRGCIRKDTTCQKRLFEKYYGMMLGICQRYAKDQDEAKDILQEGYVKIFNKLEYFNFQGSLENWIKRIMINTAIDKHRKNLQNPVSRELDNTTDASVPQDAEQNLKEKDLLNLIQTLPDGYRTVFNLYVMEGYSHEEISKELNIKEGSSKSQLAKARKLLQQKLQQLLKINDEEQSV
jgi:RNA polymerase sigma-70 factor (ECF subfamily)